MMGFMCMVGSPYLVLLHLVADVLIEVTKNYLLVLMSKPQPRLLQGCCQCWVSVC